MKTIYRLLILLIITTGISACGGNTTPQHVRSDFSESNSAVHLSIINEDSINLSQLPYDQVESFVITLSGEGVDIPRIENFSADVARAELSDIPAGAVVDIEVEAYNRDGWVFKRGRTENVRIDKGITEAILNIKRVPIFVDTNENSLLFSGRLRLTVFGEPGHQLTLTAKNESGRTFTVYDRNRNRIFIPATENGLAAIIPDDLAAGTYHLTLRDEDNRETTELNITVRPKRDVLPALVTAGTTLGSLRYGDDSDRTLSLIDSLYTE